MSISPVQKHKHWDGASKPNTSRQGDIEDTVKKKKKKLINPDVMYMGSGEGMPKRKKRKVNSENQEVEGDPIIPNKKSDGYIEKAIDQETYKKKKKRKYESHQDDASSSSIVLHQECNKKIKKAHKAKNSERLHRDELFTEKSPCRENTDQEGESKEKKRKKTKKDSRERLLDNSLVKDLSAVQTHHTKKKRKKRKDGGDLQSDGFTEEVDESVDQSERAVKKKKKERKEESPQEADGIEANDSSYIPMNNNKKKWKSGGDPQDDGFAEKFPSHRKSPDGSDAPEKVNECLDQVEKPIKKKKKRKDELHQEVKDITVDDGAPSIVLYQEQNEKIKKSHKVKDTKGCNTDEGSPEEVYREHADLTDKQSLKKKKWKGGKETSEQVDQSETYVKKKKKKRKEEPHQETDDIDDGAPSIVYQEKKKTIKKSHKAKDHKRRHGDEGLPEKALYREPAVLTDKQSLKKKKKDRLLENSLAEELSISETQHAKKKKKKQKISGDLQDDGFTEKFPSCRKSPDGSDVPEQVDECLDQVKKNIKKKKRKHEPHQEAKDIAVEDVSSSIGLHEDEPSYSEPNYTEDMPSQTKKKKSKKVLEDGSVEELLNHDAKRTNKKRELKGGRDESHRQHGFTETTEQVVETVDQTEVHVKKVKNKKHLDRSEETSDISAEETKPEGGQSLQSRVVESDGNVIDREQTPTSGQSRPQTCASTDTDQNPATQNNKRPATSGKCTKERVKGKQQSNKPFIRKQDWELIKEYFPQVKEEDIQMKFILSQELERIRIAKQKGILFRSGQFTIEEDEQIKKNVEKFMAEVGIDSPVMLFHPYYFPEHLKTINSLRKKFRFSQRIADGLYRSCDQAVVRGSLLYRFATSSGRFSAQEVKELKKYHEEHGDDYIAISKLMSRTVMSAQRKVVDLSKEVNRGPWSVDETNLLISAVKEFVLDSLQKENNSNEEPVTVPKRKLYKGIKWFQIEKKVVTRNWTHCKARWSNVISTRMNNGLHPSKGDQGRLTSMKMIQWMRDANVKDYGDVKWDNLCDDIGNVTSFCAQLHFVSLKQSVQGWKDKRLYEIVDYLYDVTMPRLEYQLSSAALEEPEKKEEFLISEMFREYSDYD
ncbi:transcription termination factor 1-like [Hyla sarda]|uniref:transcription termination factor 1-like n=1 Tax=Hyla sarda TaxID=327740 RepID=UPI0024C3004C|nr:transcription termination factor 1-like [Hyla sarda]